jgi:anti-sigma B factor antagonist
MRIARSETAIDGLLEVDERWVDEQSCLLALHGELDLSSLDRLPLERVLEARPRRLVIDLRDLEFLDVAGLHGLLNASEVLRRHGCRLVLVGATPGTRRLLELTGTGAALRQCATVGDALAEPAARGRRP